MKELQKEPRDHKWLPAGEGWETEGLGSRREPLHIDVYIVLLFNYMIELPIQKKSIRNKNSISVFTMSQTKAEL